MTAKQYLSQYRKALSEIKCKETERKTLFERATAVSPATVDGQPTAGSISDKTGTGAVNIAALDEKISEELKALETTLSDIRDTIGHIPDVDERNLLTYYYICQLTWEQVAVEMNYSYSHLVHTIHPRSLRSTANEMKKKGII